MTPIFYALNIATLAGWLAVGGASMVAWGIQTNTPLPALSDAAAKEDDLLITSQAIGSAEPGAEAAAAAAAPSEQAEEIAELSELLKLPEMPSLVAPEPLPEIPRIAELPAAQVPSVPEAAPDPTGQAKATVRPGSSKPGEAGRGTGRGNGTASGPGSSEVGSDRWEGLRKASPNYPLSARREGQEGKVVVQFTVDDRGIVVDARVLIPSPYEALNEEALQTVRRFRAKPGVRATTSQPIIFRLN
jgi:protein TonB